MTTANTAKAVSDWLNSTWLPGVEGLEEVFDGEIDISMLSVVTDTSFTAATAGTAADRDGTDGGIVFSVVIDGE